MLGSRRRVVRVGQPFGPIGEDVAELEIAEPGQREVEAREGSDPVALTPRLVVVYSYTIDEVIIIGLQAFP